MTGIGSEEFHARGGHSTAFVGLGCCIFGIRAVLLDASGLGLGEGMEVDGVARPIS